MTSLHVCRAQMLDAQRAFRSYCERRLPEGMYVGRHKHETFMLRPPAVFGASK
jgi:hypothetical protein